MVSDEEAAVEHLRKSGRGLSRMSDLRSAEIGDPDERSEKSQNRNLESPSIPQQMQHDHNYWSVAMALQNEGAHHHQPFATPADDSSMHRLSVRSPHLFPNESSQGMKQTSEFEEEKHLEDLYKGVGEIEEIKDEEPEEAE
mmetsp:Transcript_40243/g.61417  ORF Transcript_40243/g.61417 Transcript_40243/m.61417 type:complete len:141 (+) Transcript_40243:183-605(+)